MTLRGTTGEFALDVVLRLLADTKKTGELTIRGTGGEGALGIADGRVVTAVFADHPPIPALGAIFLITDAEFEFTPWTDAPAANLEGDLQDNLRKVEEYRQWMASVRQVIPTDRVRFRLSERAAEQGAVTFTSERWRVVLAVNGQRDVNDLSTHLHLERDAALTTLAGLVRDGVIETIDPPAETAAPLEPPAAPQPAPEFRAPVAESSEWTAALLSKAAAAAAPEPPPAEVAPPPPVAPWPAAVEPPPAPAEPPPAPAQEPAARVEPVAPTPWETIAPTELIAPAPPEPVAPTAQDWGAPAPEPAPKAEAAPVSQEWGPPPAPEPVSLAPAPVAPAPEPVAPAPEPAPIPQDWSMPAPVEPAAPPPPLDDRLAALFGPTGIAPSPAAPPPAVEPAPAQWTPPATTAPAATDQWTAPAPAADPWGSPSGSPAAADPRLGALTTTPSVKETPAPSSEWGPPPELGAAQPKKKGMFGRFRKEDAAPASAGHTAEMESSASSRAGLLAAFSNALLSEYNSGQYGKAHVEDRIPSLLMRVDEQADPIDKPLPVVDDRLDVQALERVALPETQAVPYLALLVSTIYGDAEKAFGRDKAKRGYRAAQQRVFSGDTSALGGDLAGKLPKV